METKRFLVVLDFDDTLVQGNSEEWVARCVIGGDEGVAMPNDLVGHYDKHRDWNAYINLLYGFLHRNNASKATIMDTLNTIQFVQGAKELLKYLNELEQQVDVIIISGGNALIIERILEISGLLHCIDEIISNPAHFDSDEKLTVGLLNTHNCQHCFKGELCKGVVIRDYLNKKAADGHEYDRIFFAGDYVNDTCLTLELAAGDVVMARTGYPLLEDLINKQAKGELKASLFQWTTGKDCVAIIDKFLLHT